MYGVGVPSLISFAGDIIICGGGGGFQGGMPKVVDVEGRGREIGEVGGAMGVGSEEEVPADGFWGLESRLSDRVWGFWFWEEDVFFYRRRSLSFCV